jgi:hypothetical protein
MGSLHETVMPNQVHFVTGVSTAQNGSGQNGTGFIFRRVAADDYMVNGYGIEF